MSQLASKISQCITLTKKAFIPSDIVPQFEVKEAIVQKTEKILYQTLSIGDITLEMLPSYYLAISDYCCLDTEKDYLSLIFLAFYRLVSHWSSTAASMAGLVAIHRQIHSPHHSFCTRLSINLPTNWTNTVFSLCDDVSLTGFLDSIRECDLDDINRVFDYLPEIDPIIWMRLYESCISIGVKNIIYHIISRHPNAFETYWLLEIHDLDTLAFFLTFPKHIPFAYMGNSYELVQCVGNMSLSQVVKSTLLCTPEQIWMFTAGRMGCDDFPDYLTVVREKLSKGLQNPANSSVNTILNAANYLLDMKNPISLGNHKLLTGLVFRASQNFFQRSLPQQAN